MPKYSTCIRGNRVFFQNLAKKTNSQVGLATNVKAINSQLCLTTDVICAVILQVGLTTNVKAINSQVGLTTNAQAFA